MRSREDSGLAAAPRHLRIGWTILVVLIFVSSMFYAGYERQLNSSLEKDLNKEKLKSERLLSEKLLLEKDMEEAKEKVRILEAKLFEIDNSNEVARNNKKRK